MAFDWLESDVPAPCLKTLTVYILKFHSVYTIFDFMVANTVVIKKNLNSESILSVISFMYNENNNGPRTVPFGDN